MMGSQNKLYRYTVSICAAAALAGMAVPALGEETVLLNSDMAALQAADNTEENAKMPMRSVNIREEYGFSSKQNIDSFLGDMVNPLASAGSSQTYSGTRSEDREKRNGVPYWRQ